MDDKTNQAPEQSGMPDNEEYSSYTLPTEDAAAQEAHTIPLEDAAAQESRTIPLEDERTQGAQDSAAQPAKKKSPLPWIIGGAAVVIAAGDHADPHAEAENGQPGCRAARRCDNLRACRYP